MGSRTAEGWARVAEDGKQPACPCQLKPFWSLALANKLDPTEQVGDRLDEPIRLNAIRFLGIHQTRTSFLSTIVAKHLPDLPPASYAGTGPAPASPSRAPQTLRTVLESARDVAGTLTALDMYSDVAPSLEASPGVLSEAGDVDLVVRVRERSRYMLRTATDVGNGEGSAVSPNRRPAGEVQGGGRAGTRGKSDWTGRLIVGLVVAVCISERDGQDSERVWGWREPRRQHDLWNEDKISFSGKPSTAHSDGSAVC